MDLFLRFKRSSGAQAELEDALIKLGYTETKTPFDGKIGLAACSEGTG